MNLFTHFREAIVGLIFELTENGDLPSGLDMSRITVEPPRDPSHGDITTNAAMVLAKPAQKNRVTLRFCWPRRPKTCSVSKPWTSQGLVF